jgi:hypothetical protein
MPDFFAPGNDALRRVGVGLLVVRTKLNGTSEAARSAAALRPIDLWLTHTIGWLLDLGGTVDVPPLLGWNRWNCAKKQSTQDDALLHIKVL